MGDHPTPPEAREFSVTELAERQDAAYKLDLRLKTALLSVRSNAWALAKVCTEVAESQSYRALGADSLNEYLGDPEIGISRSWFMELVRAWRFVEQRQLTESVSDIDLAKMRIIIPAVRDGQVASDEAIADARVLSRSDLVVKYIGSRAEPEARSDMSDQPKQVYNDAAPVVAADVVQDDPHEPQGDAGDVPEAEVVQDVEIASEPEETAPTAPEVVHPTEDEWETIVARATTHRQSLPKYIVALTSWRLLVEGGGEAREDWSVPQAETVETPQPNNPPTGLFADTADAETLDDEAEISNEDREKLRRIHEWDWADHVKAARDLQELLMDCIASGQAMPRVNGARLATLMPSLAAIIDGVEGLYVR